jgi:protein TonB
MPPAEQPAPSPTLSGARPRRVGAGDGASGRRNQQEHVDEYNKRPRKKFIGARTEEYRFAQYIEDWRQKVERIGTLNYPEARAANCMVRWC